MTLEEITTFVGKVGKYRVLAMCLVVVIAVIVAVVLLKLTDSGKSEIVINSCEESLEGDMTDGDNSDGSELTVDISGAVKSPGVYKLDAGARVVGLVEKSGGIVGDASAAWVAQNINLASPLTDSQKIYIPFEWDVQVSQGLGAASVSPFPVVGDPVTATSGLNAAIQPTTPPTSATDPPTAVGGQINVNTADSDQLQSLSGIGEVYAQRIIDERPFSDLDDLKERAKISASTIEKIGPSVVFN